MGTTGAWASSGASSAPTGLWRSPGPGRESSRRSATFSERHGEDVWLREGGYLKVSCAPTQDAGIDAVVEAARSLGIEDDVVQALSPAEVQDRCSSPRFRHGVLVHDTATVQPARLARTLRRAVLAEGVPLYERTLVLQMTAGSPNILETTGGRVRAEQVVLATNAALTGWRPVVGRLTNFGSYVVLTEPVPELLEEIGWTGDEAICDGRMFLHYFRTTNDGRVLMGSGSGPIGAGGRIDARFSHDVATAGARSARPPAPPARSRRGRARALVGRPHRRLGRPRPVLRDRSRDVVSTTAPGTRATAPDRAGSEARSWLRS